MSAEDDSVVTRAGNLLDRAFHSCAEDPKGSVHRAWGICLIFVVLYFVISIVEMVNLQATGGSKALVVAAVWTGIAHLLLGVIGTFVLKRFPTSFSVGFLLGMLMVLCNQNLILFGTFHGYDYGTIATNKTFANMALGLFFTLLFVATLLFHFKKYIVIAPIDAKGLGRSPAESGSMDYQQYGDSANA